ncbi:MAG: DUF2752 domain-containing protein [Clostridia bacterium]|nr:DUF2752 domain-containing protein [Clostridia bacterium]
MPKNRTRSFLVFHLVCLVFFGLVVGGYFLFARLRANGIPVVTCPLHDIFRLYCPFCGGSRAILSLLRFDFPTAFRVNPAVLIALPVLLVFYIRALVAFFRGDVFLYRIPRGWTITLLSLFAVFFLVRNVLLLAFGFDPAGDFIHV